MQQVGSATWTDDLHLHLYQARTDAEMFTSPLICLISLTHSEARLVTSGPVWHFVAHHLHRVPPNFHGQSVFTSVLLLQAAAIPMVQCIIIRGTGLP